MENKDFVFTEEMAEDSRELTHLQDALFMLGRTEDMGEILAINEVMCDLALTTGKGMTMLDDYSMLTPKQQKIFKKAIKIYKQNKLNR